MPDSHQTPHPPFGHLLPQGEKGDAPDLGPHPALRATLSRFAEEGKWWLGVGLIVRSLRMENSVINPLVTVEQFRSDFGGYR